jgi:hypothetical protein
MYDAYKGNIPFQANDLKNLMDDTFGNSSD